jgi:hypothetical protein
MRHINIDELPEQTDDEISEGESYAVERDGRLVGYFVPVAKEDPEKLRESLEAFDRLVEQTRISAGVSTDEVLDWVTLRENDGSSDNK